MTVAIVRATIDTVRSSMAQLLELINYSPTRSALFVKPNVDTQARLPIHGARHGRRIRPQSQVCRD